MGSGDGGDEQQRTIFSFDGSDEQRVAMLAALVEELHAGQAGRRRRVRPAGWWCSRMQCWRHCFRGEGHRLRSPIVLVLDKHGTAGAQAKPGRRQQGFRFDTTPRCTRESEALTDPRGNGGIAPSGTKMRFYGNMPRATCCC